MHHGYYLKVKELLLMKLNEPQKVLGSKTDASLEAENEILRDKLKQFESVH